YQRLDRGVFVDDWDVLAQRVSRLRGPVGSPIVVRNTLDDEMNPSVGINRSDGSFVVAYESSNFHDRRARLTEVNDTGVSHFDFGSAFYGTSVSVGAEGRYLMTYSTGDSPDLDIRGRFGR